MSANLTQRATIDDLAAIVAAQTVNSGLVDWLGIAVSLLALLLAVAGGVIAYRSYQSGRADAAHSHMHNLFRDYLRLRFDYSAHAKEAGHALDAKFAGSPPGSSAKNLRDQMISYKLYALEEMFAWVSRQRSLSDSVISRPWAKDRRQALKDQIDSWEETILVHTHNEWRDVRSNLFDYTRCYSIGFLCLVSKDWKLDTGLRDWVALHKKAVENDWPRPSEEEGRELKRKVPKRRPWRP